MYFDRLNDGDNFSILNILQPGTNIKDLGWLGCLSRYLKHEMNYDYYLVAMFSSICMECLNGVIIRELKNSQKKLYKSISFLIIVPDKFTENEVDNMKTSLNMNIQVIIADKDLSITWNQLIENYGGSKINIILFLLNKGGDVLSVMNPSYYKEFFNNLIKMTSTA